VLKWMFYDGGDQRPRQIHRPILAVGIHDKDFV